MIAEDSNLMDAVHSEAWADSSDDSLCGDYQTKTDTGLSQLKALTQNQTQDVIIKCQSFELDISLMPQFLMRAPKV